MNRYEAHDREKCTPSPSALHLPNLLREDKPASDAGVLGNLCPVFDGMRFREVQGKRHLLVIEFGEGTLKEGGVSLDISRLRG